MQFIIGKHHGYKYMISVKLNGGLANAMFQIATIETLGKTFSQEVCYSNIDEWLNYQMGNYEWIKHAEDYLDIFPNIDFYKNHYQRFKAIKQVDVGFKYAQVAVEDGLLFTGYFQSEKNFPDKQFIDWLFTPSDKITGGLLKYNSLLQGNTCSIHVRRGNYRNLQNHHPVLNMDYYNKSIKTLKPFKIDRFFVFSNEINWCKNNFIGDEYTFIQDVDYIELFLMAQCKYHIISNSSFGWWGAWLKETTDTVIIAPEVWFGNFLPQDHASDIVPERWTKI
jgi:hypothetical protein